MTLLQCIDFQPTVKYYFILKVVKTREKERSWNMTLHSGTFSISWTLHQNANNHLPHIVSRKKCKHSVVTWEVINSDPDSGDSGARAARVACRTRSCFYTCRPPSFTCSRPLQLLVQSDLLPVSSFPIQHRSQIHCMTLPIIVISSSGHDYCCPKTLYLPCPH